MYKEILNSVEGISIYPIISLIVFVLFFSIILIWMFKVDKTYIKKMENLPFEKEGENNFNNSGDLYEKKV
ncbi:MAG: cbb3-type cytochrome c oxidase subunit 3 [Ignavibacteriaceae bacterium]|nr:cbb3-type cytochrome c oxidase subunit 3 [Ignavibacterium sp.]MCC6254551.1 cbb3-type cytochrome c oxidase subunit 3 [Ignavibacteriaceae bacterium]HMN23628.1 cbb3-type cytochrome c oxidase subunit 3 [Ignavibacteriaceae bacterium]HRN26878.1 cbb3-type cytochrome c oxidase subunit 3 [Ignavibacteriaceae bacterium]HRP92658.1 cbb3-type cytochrome c oxidase subunit 3 [Ignavibacteriaceae bacterium]